MILSRDKAFYHQVFRLTGFIALQNVIVCFVGLADNVMLGAFSQDALSGVALANQVQFLLQMLIGAVGEGMAVIAAQYWGTSRLQPIRRVVAIALEFALAMSVLFFAVAQLCPEWLLGLLANDAAAIAEGAAYMRIVSFSYLFFSATMVLISAQRSIENVRVGMISSMTGLLVNIALNWVLIFGNLGAPRLGARGAAIATLIARMAECGVALVYTYGINRKLSVAWHDLIHPDQTLLHDFWRIASPVIFSGASWGIAQGVQTSILGHLGSSAIAANAIANSLFQVISVVAYGMSSASAVVIGKAVGRGDRDHLKGYVNALQLLYVVIGVLSCAALLACKDAILTLYAVTPEAHAMADSFLTVLSITIIGTAYQCSCLTGIVRGGGNTKFVFYNDLIFMWGIVLPVSLLAAFVWHWNPVLVFFCLKSDQLSKCLVAIWQVNSYHWVRKVTREDIG
ncbi:MAG: MATE family efflux transporter [Clostridia bacterium]